MDVDQVRALLQRSCNGNIKAWCDANGLSAGYVHDVLARRKEPGDAILKALKVSRTVSYQAPEPVVSLLQSQFDMEVGENVKQAAFEYERCVSDYDYRRWATRFGAALLSHRQLDMRDETIASLEAELDTEREACASAEGDATEAQDEAAISEQAIKDAIAELDGIRASDPAIPAIIQTLEAAL